MTRPPYRFILSPALCVSRERRPFPSLEIPRDGSTKPRDNDWETVAAWRYGLRPPAVERLAQSSERLACFVQRRITQMWLSKALYKVSGRAKRLPIYLHPLNEGVGLSTNNPNLVCSSASTGPTKNMIAMSSIEMARGSIRSSSIRPRTSIVGSQRC